jgi:hypothetical protein
MKNFRRFYNWARQTVDDLLHPYDVTEIDTSVVDMIYKLEERIALLEQENCETTNELYRLENSLDARIDILVEHCRIFKDV